MTPRIEIHLGDITAMDTDAIVNAANNQLILGAGVAGAIRRAGGPSIQEECDAIGPIPLGEAALTGAGALKARHVIHAASMGPGAPTTARSLEDATRNALRRAEERHLESIAFPAIGTGIAGFPLDDCARIMIAAVLAHFGERERRGRTGTLRRVCFVLFDEAARDTFAETLAPLQRQQ